MIIYPPRLPRRSSSPKSVEQIDKRIERLDERIKDIDFAIYLFLVALWSPVIIIGLIALYTFLSNLLKCTINI